jgi:mutator protein MutT
MTTPFKRGIDYIGVGVGACILNEVGEVLLAQRGPLAKNERGTWEIPGGGVEFGETLEVALKREILEEIGVEIKIISLLQVCDHILPAEKQHWVSPTYLCHIVSGEPTIKEPGKCSDMGWFSLEAAAKLPLSQVTQSDIAMLQTRASALQ